MGCATSSPFITSTTDGILKAAKGAANNMTQAGEETVNGKFRQKKLSSLNNRLRVLQTN